MTNLSGLVNNSIAGGQTGGHFPTQHHQRIIPRCNYAANAEFLFKINFVKIISFQLLKGIYPIGSRLVRVKLRFGRA